ncbi:MAG: hypothetical protein U0X58_04030 [Flavobacteriaceae bacterium]
MINSGSTISLDAGSQDVQSVYVNTAISAISYTIGNGACRMSLHRTCQQVLRVFYQEVFIHCQERPNTAGVYNYTLSTVGKLRGVATQSGSITVNPDAKPVSTASWVLQLKRFVSTRPLPILNTP